MTFPGLFPDLGSVREGQEQVVEALLRNIATVLYFLIKALVWLFPAAVTSFCDPGCIPILMAFPLWLTVHKIATGLLHRLQCE